ncbi:MAG: hypothetical protein NVS9B3_04820 [Gemmatimonadaceae bacterium]
MTVVPVLFDTLPAYAGRGGTEGSLLSLPLPDVPLIVEIMSAVRKLTSAGPIIVARFEPDAGYASRLREHCSNLVSVVRLEELGEAIGAYDPADEFLLIDPSCYPVDGIPLREALGKARGRAPAARHLLAFEGRATGSMELVHGGDAGRVRRVQRYFQPATWPLPTGIVASLVRGGWMQAASTLPLSSLEDLRRSLSARGARSEDVRLEGNCVMLGDEAEALSLIERRVCQLEQGPRRRQTSAPAVDATSVIAPSARLIGPVRVGPGAHIADNVLIVGPSVIARGARLGKGVVLAQCLVLPGAVVDPGATIRHRVVAARGERLPEVRQRRSVAPPTRARAGTESVTAAMRYQTAKAWAEPVIAITALVLLAPVLVIVAVLVCLDSAGPILYAARREGRGARVFRCWKFRSMQVNAEAMQRALGSQQQMDGPQFKMERDPRVTRVGRWLRRLNLDELPQLWNVVRGEMSFVGPRPSPFTENQVCVPWRHGRLSVRPGITGLWQVCRRDRALGDFHQWIRYDLLYVRHASLSVDLKILLATFRAAAGKHPVPVSAILPIPALRGDGADPRARPAFTERTGDRRRLHPASVLFSRVASVLRGEEEQGPSASPTS